MEIEKSDKGNMERPGEQIVCMLEVNLTAHRANTCPVIGLKLVRIFPVEEFYFFIEGRTQGHQGFLLEIYAEFAMDIISHE